MDETMDGTLDECWPEGFGAMGGQTFETAYRTEQKFVAITLDGMSDATGIFKRWYDFCVKKSKTKPNGQTPATCDGKSANGD